MRKKKMKWYRRRVDKTKGIEVPLIVSGSVINEYRANNPGKTKMDLLIELYPDIQTAIAKFKLYQSIDMSTNGAKVKRKLKGFMDDVEITAIVPNTHCYGGGKKMVVYITTNIVNAIVSLSKVEDKIMEKLLNA